MWKLEAFGLCQPLALNIFVSAEVFSQTQSVIYPLSADRWLSRPYYGVRGASVCTGPLPWGAIGRQMALVVIHYFRKEDSCLADSWEKGPTSCQISGTWNLLVSHHSSDISDGAVLYSPEKVQVSKPLNFSRNGLIVTSMAHVARKSKSCSAICVTFVLVRWKRDRLWVWIIKCFFKGTLLKNSITRRYKITYGVTVATWTTETK